MNALLCKKVLLLDGGLGTTLEDQFGVTFGQQTPLWSSHLLITDPKTLSDAQEKFATAGADILLTPTYQASASGFQKTSAVNWNPTHERICAAYGRAVDISRNAFRGRPGLVALSLGAYGATLQPSQEYSGDYGAVNEADLHAFHQERTDAILDWDVIDLVAFETLPRLDEVRAVSHIMNAKKPFWISCVFPEANRLPDGTSIRDVLLAAGRPWGIGINCTKVEKIESLVLEYELEAQELQITLPRLILYPDGTNGQVYDTSSQKWVGDQQDSIAWDQQVIDIVRAVLRRGNWTGIVVGGCCKASPDHIAKLRKRIDELT